MTDLEVENRALATAINGYRTAWDAQHVYIKQLHEALEKIAKNDRRAFEMAAIACAALAAEPASEQGEATEAMRVKCYKIVEDRFFLSWRRGENQEALNEILNDIRALKDKP